MTEDWTETILTEFEKMRKREYANGERFKVIAYSKAMEAIKQLGKPIQALNDVKGVRNIGKKSLAKIEEIILTGSLAAAQRASADPKITAINQFSQIYGIGMVKARELVLENNILNLEELRRNQDNLLNDVQIIGLKYHDELNERIPFSEMKEHETFLLRELKDLNKDAKGSIAGSFRRKSPDSGDIDFLITEKNGSLDIFNKFVEKLTRKGYLVAKLARGPSKFNGVCQLADLSHRRIDILYAPPKEYPFALLYFTGSKLFNTEMRQKVQEQGYSLNEKGLTIIQTEKVLDRTFSSEREIMEFLGFEYVEPEHRNSNALKLKQINRTVKLKMVTKPNVTKIIIRKK